MLADERLVRDRVAGEIRERFAIVSLKQSTGKHPVRKVKKCVEITGGLDCLFFEMPPGAVMEEKIVAEIRHLAPGVRVVCCFHSNAYVLRGIRFVDGVLLKPVTKYDVYRAVKATASGYYKSAWDGKPEIRVHTFGNFDVFVEGKLLTFERNKAKELFAYLIDRKGAGATTSEIAAVLWEDREYSKGILSQTTRTISILRKVLEQNGIGDVLVKSWNSLAINPERVQCDAYAYEKGEEWALNAYGGEYMRNYSWAETMNGKMQKDADSHK